MNLKSSYTNKKGFFLGEKNLEQLNDLGLITENIISPSKEMLAYETLWAIHDIKEKMLRELFSNHIPSKALLEVSSAQADFFEPEKSLNETENKVSVFLEEQSLDQNHFSFIVNKNFQCPEVLMKEYPVGLFYYKGDLSFLETRLISIVGSRKPSKEGITRAQNLAKGLVEENFTIVSGLAEGIDASAHKSAIENNGRTIGIIGTPINEYYPKSNKKLQEEIEKNHLLISQVPFYRYANEPFSSRKFHFPRRNKLMASISEATIVVEASDTSGSHSQARECLKQKKKLFILDSCFNNEKIKWPKKYLEKGAIRVKELSDILENINE